MEKKQSSTRSVISGLPQDLEWLPSCDIALKLDCKDKLVTPRVMPHLHGFLINWEIGQEGQYKQTENIKQIVRTFYLPGDSVQN